jgi:hypothetical protein
MKQLTVTYASRGALPVRTSLTCALPLPSLGFEGSGSHSLSLWAIPTANSESETHFLIPGILTQLYIYTHSHTRTHTYTYIYDICIFILRRINISYRSNQAMKPQCIFSLALCNWPKHLCFEGLLQGSALLQNVFDVLFGWRFSQTSRKYQQ